MNLETGGDGVKRTDGSFRSLPSEAGFLRGSWVVEAASLEVLDVRVVKETLGKIS